MTDLKYLIFTCPYCTYPSNGVIMNLNLNSNYYSNCIFSVWYYFGAVGSFCFIIIQLILLVDFAHSWNQSWLQRAEDGNTKCWFAGNRSGQ